MAGPVIPPNLPSGAEVMAQGRRLGETLSMGRSSLCEAHDVASEVEYKRKMQAEGRIMTAMNIGLQTWPETARALETIHRESAARGFRIDRYQMNLDRRMGLPRQFWQRAAKETGPMLESTEQWRETTRTVPIQPHLGDMMIGSPASVENTCQALEAGVNYIGNLSQFHWQYPGWPGDDAEQVGETVKALSIMATKADAGAMVHSYLDDGFCAQFQNYGSYLGWAKFERYVVDELIGARLSVSYGGLSHHPVTKAAMILALEQATPPGNMNAFYHGNTTAYSTELDENFGVFSVDALYMTLAKSRAGGGAAILSVPVTEPVRIPTPDEIVQIQTVARRVIDDAPRLEATVNWPHIEALAERITASGERFYASLMQGLAELGLDLEDPLALLLAVRRLGAKTLEERFGDWTTTAASHDDEARQPPVPTDTFLDFLQQRNHTRTALTNAFAGSDKKVDEANECAPRILIASADIHEYAVNLLDDALRHLGFSPVLAGVSLDPEEVARQVLANRADLLLVSTHNGMALTYAEQLMSELRFAGVQPIVGMGGVLNQDDERFEAPVDVRPDLRDLGIAVCDDIASVTALVNRAANA